MQSHREHFFVEILKYGLIALLIVVPIRLYVAQPFIVSGASMEPAFENGQYLIVDQLTYSALGGKPRRGDVIIFKYPRDPSKFFIKRIIGLPGETVELEGEHVTIYSDAHLTGVTLKEPYLTDPNAATYAPQKVELGEDEYFVLGDNRRASSDSRTWGPLAESLIVGRAYVRLLPPTTTEFLPGSVSPADIL